MIIVIIIGSGRKFQSSFYEGSELDNCDDNNNK